jgi:hypothetical protein
MPREFISRYTHDLTSDELGKLFTRETPEAYRFFARGINTAELEGLPWYQKALRYAQGFFLAFTMRLSPARRLMYGVALGMSVIGLLELFNGFGLMRVPLAPFIRIFVPAPLFSDGTLWLLSGFLLMNLLVLLEVADRLSLKRDLEVAREIQQAMLPEGTWSGPGVEAFGLTKPANTVGGDFYDILPRPDGTVMVALGDVAGKASPAALLMALLLAMLRTLVDEELPLPVLVQRLNLQVTRHAPSSRFITLFLSSTRRPAGCSSSTPARHLRCCGGKMDPLNGCSAAVWRSACSPAARTRPAKCSSTPAMRCFSTATALPRPRALTDSRSTKPASSALSRCMPVRIKSRQRPSWVERFSTRLSAIAGISASPTTSQSWS